jgi:23S rRNA pseudouridine1911/1915/1917 synthase
VDGKTVKPSHHTRGGEHISVTIPDPEPSLMVAEDIPLDIVFEDRHLLVVNKSAGMVVHPGSGVRKGTLANALLAHCGDLSGIGGVLRPGIVHRLDKDTTGLLLVAKDDKTHLALSNDLKERRIGRKYAAVVWGTPREEGRIETLIGRSRSDRKKMAVLRAGGRNAITSIEIKETFEFASLLGVTLQTGRTHQIRVHMSHIGHPVFGDPTYGGRRRKYGSFSKTVMDRARGCLELIDRQALHAGSLTFTHPAKGSEMKLEAPLPGDMKLLIDALRGGSSEGGQR